MRERQRWLPEDDAVLRAYVRQHGPREWHLVSQRMRVALDRGAKSCLERWKNYLRPGIKKGSLSEDEQRLVTRLQAKHGNKWKRISAEVPGRTAKRLGKWWEVFREKQNRRDARTPDEQSTTSYDWLLERFAEKLVGDQPAPPVLMAPAPVLPQWLNANSSCNNSIIAEATTTTQMLHLPPSPSVTLSLASSAPWPPQPDAYNDTLVQLVDVGRTASELAEWCREEEEEGHRAWVVQRKEAAWRLRRVEAQLEAERERRRREVAEEFEARARELREQREAAMERVEAEHREQVRALRRDAEAKEEKTHWAARVAQAYDSSGLQCFFLMNNLHFAVKQVEGSELISLLGHSWVQVHRDFIEQYMETYVDLSWGPVLSCLSTTRTGMLGGCFSRPSSTARFCHQFDATYYNQECWKVEDPRLREIVRRAVNNQIISAYRAHFEKYGKVQRHYEWYTPELLEAQLMQLFEGRTG